VPVEVASCGIFTRALVVSGDADPVEPVQEVHGQPGADEHHRAFQRDAVDAARDEQGDPRQNGRGGNDVPDDP
jgi:hypothetical protein